MLPAHGRLELKFGPYTVDLRAGELRKNGLRIRLQEKPLLVLALLADRPGQVVTREELKKHLWPDETFVDFETGLNTAVKKLRGALSDDPEKPRYIETLPRRGYRFLTPVEVLNGNFSGGRQASPAIPLQNPPAPAGPQIVPPAEPPLTTTGHAEILADSHKQIEALRSSSRLWIWGIVSIAAALLVFTFWWLSPLPAPQLTDIIRITQTGRMDYVVRPATDGVRLFYVQRAGDHYDLMQSSLNGEDTQKIAAPFPNTLVWDVGPDGSTYLITSFERRGQPSPLWLWPATGGSPVKIGELNSGSASFSPDGKQIVYHFQRELLVANTDGTHARKLASFPEEPDSPVWSPDGKTIRFTRNDYDRDSASIWEIGLDGGNLHLVQPLSEPQAWQCCGTWTPDGRYFLYSEHSPKLSKLYAIREKGSSWRRSPRGPFLLGSAALSFWGPLVSRDGSHVFYYDSSYQEDLETLDPATGQFTALLHEARPVMLSPSRDSQWVSYIQVYTGLLWMSRFDGSDARRIPLENMRGAFPRLSPDNQLIAFTGIPKGQKESVFVVSANGGTPRPVVAGALGMSDPDWSPDGARLVVDRDIKPEPGKTAPTSRLSIVDLKSSHITDVPGSEDLHQPRWSPDGKFIAAVRGSAGEMRVYEFATQSWRSVAQMKSVSYPVWSGDSSDIYFQNLLSPGEPVYRYHMADGAHTEIASFQRVLDAGMARCVFVALSPTGTPIVGFDRSSSDIFSGRLTLP